MYRLHDSSVWIEFRKGIVSRRTDRLRNDLIANRVYICPVIIQEVLQGIRLDRDFQNVKKDFEDLLALSWDATEAAISAAMLYRQLRQKGITIRKPNDCLIAAFAIHFDVELCHNDRDFDQIAAHTDLKIWSA
ncbi:PIN domain-containing protein [Persicitalea sp.]|uniref:type II toxin-antitoxin system VapC family toxin n=1 Tax=Persicitalea sp. TaxID=3100273 RepID=UPI003593BBAE